MKVSLKYEDEQKLRLFHILNEQILQTIEWLMSRQWIIKKGVIKIMRYKIGECNSGHQLRVKLNKEIQLLYLNLDIQIKCERMVLTSVPNFTPAKINKFKIFFKKIYYNIS